MKREKDWPLDVFILIAPGFDEKLVILLISSFREAGIASALVSLTPGLIKSFRGVQVHADLSIDQLPPTVLPRFIFVLETYSCASTLLADPRLHQLLERTVVEKRIVAVMPEARRLFQEIGFPDVMTMPELVKFEPLLVREYVNQIVGLLTD